MLKSTIYVQSCPTCGRALEVRVWYLGREVMCRHCGAPFIASMSDGRAGSGNFGGSALLRRAEELIDLAERRKKHVQA